jgi:hypothetical protein
MSANLTRPRPHFLRRFTLLILALVGTIATGLVAQSSATAATTAGKTTVVKATLQIPANPMDNLCNGDVVNLHGKLNITTATTTLSNGAVRVVSTSRFTGTGSRIAPPPEIGYYGDDRQNTAEYTAPPPYPSTFSVLQWTKLVPRRNAPTMWLVFVLREVVTPEGTVPTLERTYLTCMQPTSHDCHKER